MMNGRELVEYINNNSMQDKSIDTILFLLLKQNVIKPSNIIDAYTESLQEEIQKYKCHFEDSCVSAFQILGGHYHGKYLEEAKKRFSYNTSFSQSLKDLEVIKLTKEEREYWKNNFEKVYGIKP
jgi:hypothetical protein